MLQNETIRETLRTETGRDLVILNVSYPAPEKKKVFGKKKDPLRAHFEPFYRRAAEAFADFARKELLEKAKKNGEELPPCGAVLHWKQTQETDDTLAVCIEGTVFNGVESFAITKDERVWNKKTGLLVKDT